MNPQKGVCCQYCIKFEKSACPIKEASPWSRWGDWCSQYEPNPDEKEPVTREEALSSGPQPQGEAVAGKYGEPWRTTAPPNGGVLLKMGPDEMHEAVQIFPKEKGERIKECVNACAGMDDPAGEIAALRRDAERYRTLRRYDSGYRGDEAFPKSAEAYDAWVDALPDTIEPADEGAQQ